MATAELGINVIARNQARGVLKNLQGDLRGVKGALGDIAKFTAGNLIAGGIAAGVNAVTTSVKASVGAFASMANEAADFNAQISSIGAVAGASAAQVAELKQLALDLGVNPNLKVSAVEAAQAIEMLARNGLKVPEIMGGAAEATVLLANATGADFSTAANIGTDAMALFGIEANNMIAAVDGITSVTTNSKFNINDYALALAQGGGVAATVGVSFEDFNATMAGIAPLFKSGSDAGTSFKTFLQRLVPQTDQAAESMASLGLLAEDGTSVFFDANGQMKNMSEIAGILNRSLSGLSEEQKILQLSTIFGADAMRAAAGIAKFTTEEFLQLQATMGETSAVEGAATRMDNLAGDMEIFRSVVESLRIQVGDRLQPALRDVFQGGTQLLAAFTPQILAFADAVGNAMSAAVGRIQAAKEQFDFLNSGGNFGGGLLAALGSLTGGTVNVPIGATVVDVDWGILSASFDNASKDLSVSIGDVVTGTFNIADYTTTIDIGDMFTGTLDINNSMLSIRWGDYVGTLDWANWVVSLTWGDYVYSLSWSDVIATLGSWSTYITTVTWSEFIGDLSDWSAYVTPIIWSEFISFLEWTGLISTIDDWSTYVSSVNWVDYITQLDWRNIVATIVDWSTWIPVLSWVALIKVVEWGAYIEGLIWDGFVSLLTWDEHVSSLAWDIFVGVLDWSTFVMSVGWDSFITKLEWVGIIESPEWAQWLKELNWAEYVRQIDWAGFIESLTWDNFVATLEWGAFASSLVWGQFIANLSWNMIIPRISWSDFVNGVNLADWIPPFPGWNVPDVPGGSQQNQDSGAFDDNGTFNYGQNAIGTRNWRGGLTWVGETGPELVNLPRNSRIYSNSDSMALAGAGAGGVNVTVNVANVSSEIDINAMAYQVANVVKRMVR